MALVEAMLLEKPILASKTPACIELLGDAGILLPTNDCEAWREAIIELIDNPVMAQRLGDLALKAVEGFTPERMTQNYLALIQTNVPESPMSNEIGHPRQYPS